MTALGEAVAAAAVGEVPGGNGVMMKTTTWLEEWRRSLLRNSSLRGNGETDHPAMRRTPNCGPVAHSRELAAHGKTNLRSRCCCECGALEVGTVAVWSSLTSGQ